jgi:hypothetical protein
VSTLFDPNDTSWPDPRNTSGARFSPCRTWRYHLWRVWGPGPRLIVIGLNPSTADEHVNDQTITRCIKLAKREGCNGLEMLNLFGFRSTDPRGLKSAADPIGPGNDEVIGEVIALGAPVERVVAAWGVHGGERGDQVYREITGWGCPVWCLGTNADGTPKHPLYLPNSAPLVVYRGRP